MGELLLICSTFDEYASEVRSGKLEWSPPHLSEQFWKQNAGRLNEKDFELLRWEVVFQGFTETGVGRALVDDDCVG